MEKADVLREKRADDMEEVESFQNQIEEAVGAFVFQLA